MLYQSSLPYFVGFASSFVVKVVGHFTFGEWGSNTDPTDVIARTLIAATLGETISKLQGGNFANGAHWPKNNTIKIERSHPSGH